MSENKSEDQIRWEYEQNRTLAERAHDQENTFIHKLNDAAILTGNHTLRALIIINGGAAIALLAFIGHLISVQNGVFSKSLGELTAPLIWFAWGVALATVSMGFSYVTNYSYSSHASRKSKHYQAPYIRETLSSKRWLRFGFIFQIFAVLTAIVSIYLFVSGMVEIRDVIKGLKPPVAVIEKAK